MYAIRSYYESDKRYDSFINNNADLMFVKDHSKKYLLINNSMSDFFGKTKNEIIRNNFV